MKIVLLGGNGLLGTELRKIDKEILSPRREEVDIRDFSGLFEFLSSEKPDIVINAAAVIDNREVEKDASLAIQTNIVGAANVARACSALNLRYVYISTDYVYRGDRGNYRETDEIMPFNAYAWTKLGGECSAVCVKNHLIVRTSFGPSKFPYGKAFVDKWTSKDYVDRVASMIYEASLSPLTGVLNLGTNRKSIYEHASERSEVEAVKMTETAYASPYDTSLNLQRWHDYQRSDSIAKSHTTCRICGNRFLRKYLDLGLMPLANNLEFSSLRARQKERFPLQVLFCEECSLSQLSTVIDPGKMFSYYTYRSAINQGYVKHCREMAIQAKEMLRLTSDDLVIDIAGNDGTLLNEFKKETGVRVLNIDPAQNLTAIAESNGIESYAEFWGESVAKKALKEKGKARLVTATNVFAHVDNVHEFVDALKVVSDENTVILFEFPYLVDFIDHNEFDTVYFEHLSYFGVNALEKLFRLHGMRIVDVQRQNIHGGTIRVLVSLQDGIYPSTDNVSAMIDDEERNGFLSFERYRQWSTRVKSIIEDFGENLLRLKKDGKKIAAFAASAKGNTLLNAARMTTDIIEYIADETPEKIGKFSPGTGIPIVNKQELERNPPDYLIILSWNFKEEIIEKVRKIYSGKIIIPIPSFQVIEGGSLNSQG